MRAECLHIRNTDLYQGRHDNWQYYFQLRFLMFWLIWSNGIWRKKNQIRLIAELRSTGIDVKEIIDEIYR